MKRRVRRMRKLRPWYFELLFFIFMVIPMGLILALSSQYLQVHKARYEQEQRINMLHQLSSVRAHIENALNQNLLPLRGLMAHISLHGRISRENFETVAEALLAYHTDVRNIALVEGTVIRLVYPYASSEMVVGVDLLTVPEQSNTVAQVRETLEPVLAGPFELIQGGRALIGRLPISSGTNDPFQQATNYWGQVSVVIDFEQFLDSSGLSQSNNLRLALRGVDGSGAKGPIFFGDPALFATSSVLLAVSLPSGTWLLAGMPQKGWPDEFPLIWPIRIVKWLLLVAWLLLSLSIRHYFKRHEESNKRLQTMNEELEIRVRERSDDLAEKQAQLAHAGRLASLGEMATAIAHEVGQPLQIIKTSTGIIREDLRNNQLDPAQVHMLVEKIVSSVDRAATIIQHVRNFARQDNKPVTDRVSLQRPAKEAVSLFNAQFREHEIILETTIEENLPPILVQPHKIQQIIVNLLSNARYAVEAKATTDHTFQKAIQLKLYADSTRNTLVLEVTDNGIGITDEVKQRCMDPFFTTKPMNEGTGLGLSILHGIVKEYQGTVEIESTPEKGTTFRITLPVNP
ncbi:MAG: ATP-binding protein [Kiritimatiellae bacterium]|nr:ATP-binding protein [Kiritimatiellia bacterium]